MEDQTKSNYFIKFPPSYHESLFIKWSSCTSIWEWEKSINTRALISSSKHWINLIHGAPNLGIGDYAFEAIVVQLGLRPKANSKIPFNTKYSLVPHQIISDTSTTNFSTTSKLCRKFKFGMQALSNPNREIIEKHIH